MRLVRDCMQKRITTNQRPLMSSRLTAVFVICWSLGTNTHVITANTLAVAKTSLPELPTPALPVPGPVTTTEDVLTQNLQLLSPGDADLYRIVFAAQEKSDWVGADAALAKINNRRLVGHVLADRYLRQTGSAKDMQAWLGQYSDLPEAAEIYDEISSTYPQQVTKLLKPAVMASWAGDDGYGGSFGFKTETSDEPRAATTSSHELASKISHILRQGDPYTAESLLEAEQVRRDLPIDELSSLEATIAAGYFYEGQKDRAYKLARGAALQSQTPLALWISGLCAWQEGDTAVASDAFSKLAAQSGLSDWDEATASFWAYRALTRLGDHEQAQYWLENAANHPHSFYGFLAAHLVKRDAAWSWQMPILTKQHVATLTSFESGWRAMALLQIGERSLAESEMRNINPQGQRELQEAMVAVAAQAQMPSLALQLGSIATRANGDHYAAALYPLPPWQPEHGFQIDRALLYALMRHESQFDPMAISERGACGLMQLMPTTANLIARHHVTTQECSDRVLDPAYNMALGQKYVRQLASQPMIGNNLLLLLAAYNGGPNKLARWIDDANQKDPLLFVESLPVHETRDYVERVLMHYWIYRARLDEPQTGLTQLAHGEWPRYSLRDEALTKRDEPLMKHVDLSLGGEVHLASSQK